MIHEVGTRLEGRWLAGVRRPWKLMEEEVEKTGEEEGINVGLIAKIYGDRAWPVVSKFNCRACSAEGN